MFEKSSDHEGAWSGVSRTHSCGTTTAWMAGKARAMTTQSDVPVAVFGLVRLARRVGTAEGSKREITR